MPNSEIIKNLDYIQNKSFCRRNTYLALKKWNDIKNIFSQNVQLKMTELIERTNDNIYPDNGTVNDCEKLANYIKELKMTLEQSKN